MYTEQTTHEIHTFHSFLFSLLLERFRITKVRLAVRRECGRKMAYEIRRFYVSHFAKFDFFVVVMVLKRARILTVVRCTICTVYMYKSSPHVHSPCSHRPFLSQTTDPLLASYRSLPGLSQRSWTMHGGYTDNKGFPSRELVSKNRTSIAYLSYEILHMWVSTGAADDVLLLVAISTRNHFEARRTEHEATQTTELESICRTGTYMYNQSAESRSCSQHVNSQVSVLQLGRK